MNSVHNAVVLVQAVLLFASAMLSAVKGVVILDRALDLVFAGYLCLLVIKCLFDRPTLRWLGGMALVGAYGMAGMAEAYLNQNLGGFMYEAKLLVSLALFLCLLEERPTLSDRSVKILFASFVISACCFLAFNPGLRLHLVNESNYLCMYVGIAMFSYLSSKGEGVKARTIVGLGIFTLFLIVASQSRTGAGFLVLAWLVYSWERYGFLFSAIVAAALGVLIVMGAAVAIALDAPIVSRFEELKDPNKVDRFIYLVEANKIIESRPFYENLVRTSFAEPVSTRVANDMKWLTSKEKVGMEQGQLYPHHFHLAYLRLLLGHGFVALLLYLLALPFLWRFNRYLALGLGVCSLSMSVPYLSVFFGALQIAMAFPTAKPPTPMKGSPQ